METIRVNMTPCEDVQTIHASQNDNEGREWGFELHNNGEKIDSSSISDQLVFKAYEGGTEQILPENGSTPTTSPFNGDIKYPQGLLSDQEFLYRESPTEEDGLAKITDIKGNTLVWNQLVQNGNFASTSGWSKSSASTFSVSNNVATFLATGQYQNIVCDLPMQVVGHKYLMKYDVKFDTALSASNQYEMAWNNGAREMRARPTVLTANTWQTVMVINESVNVGTASKLYMYDNRASGWSNVQLKNIQIFDLTQMGLDISNPSDFTSLFPLSYYAYNQGTLLSFNGNGIKTVGKNLFDFSQFANGTITFENGDLKGTAGQFSASYSNVVSNGIELKYPENTQITISFDARTEQNDAPSGNGIYLMASENGTSTRLARATNETTSIQHITATIPSNRHIDKLGWTYGANALNIWHITNFQVEFGATETSYEPYTTSTTSLPISTYFPSGMKSAGSVYDELTPIKAITRIGAVDLGTLDWTLSSPTSHIFRGKLTGTNAKIPNASDLPNALLANYQPEAYNPISANDNGRFALGYRRADEVDVLVIIDSNYSTQDSFISHISGQYLYYELATPIETSFTTASLVTENAEIPLSNEDGVLIGKCTEQLSSESGFFDAKIKLADEDGECYSNKIQLHVERKPS